MRRPRQNNIPLIWIINLWNGLQRLLVVINSSMMMAFQLIYVEYCLRGNAIIRTWRSADDHWIVYQVWSMRQPRCQQAISWIFGVLPMNRRFGFHGHQVRPAISESIRWISPNNHLIQPMLASGGLRSCGRMCYCWVSSGNMGFDRPHEIVLPIYHESLLPWLTTFF